jgi:uncharacterized membrane protein
MEKNIGKLDRIFRLIISVVLLLLFFTKTVTGVLGIVILIFAIVFLLTSITGFCGLYKLLGIRT